MQHYLRALRSRLLQFCGVVWLLYATTAQANIGETITQLVEQTVTAEVVSRYAHGTYTVTPQPVANLRLKPCDELVAEVRSQNLHGRVPVHVRCVSPAPWSLYASATVSVEVPVLVTRRAIARGERITAESVSFENISLHRLRPQTISDMQDIEGKVARRALSAHQAVTLHHLSTPLAVAKGERVHIQSTSGRVTIGTYGVALSGGRAGEQIQVRNESSRRIIRPWILGPGKVATSPPGV